MAAACAQAARDPDTVRIVAASKMQPPAMLSAAIAAGLDSFGENRVQEAKAKWPALKAAHPWVKLHLIGPLQSNKVKEAVALFDAIDSVDRAKIARRLAAEMAAQDRVLPCLIQVNTGAEPQKAGVTLADLPELIELCRDALDLPLRGLMCIPPAEADPAYHFALLAKLAARHDLPVLSMGMSGDFETAIAMGATEIRPGSVLFGPRDSADPPA